MRSVQDRGERIRAKHIEEEILTYLLLESWVFCYRQTKESSNINSNIYHVSGTVVIINSFNTKIL